MSRSLALGNGNILVCFDKNAQVRDFYFPYVGLENHIGGHFVHRIGVWVDGNISWISEKDWSVIIESGENAPVGNTTAINEEIGVNLKFLDVVYNEKNIFIRKVLIKNARDYEREIKLYFCHEFELYETRRGDTAYFDPVNNAVIHYKGKRVFLVNGVCEYKKFDDYTTGVFHIQGKDGSYKDAEDGVLSKNPIEHGLTDSVLGFYRAFKPNEERVVHYWVAVGESIDEVVELNKYVLEKNPDYLINTTHDFWNAWINKIKFSFFDLDDRIIKLFKKSLFIIRAHSDNSGAIIASGDSSMLQGGKDTYGYMWPRDAAFSALALDMAGYVNVSQRLLSFCNNIITDQGYFMHKYKPDGSLGSSWHPWVRNGAMELPIQEDETALIIYSLWEHYKISKDLEFIESVYNSLVKKSADFMVAFRDEKTGLPKPSYDLWEEHFGISTFTTSSVYGALNAASNFAKLLGKKRSAIKYEKAANEIKEAILKYLYDSKEGVFYKMINMEKSDTTKEYQIDKTIDMSAPYGILTFGVLEPNDERMKQAMEKAFDRLSCKTLTGGVARYEGDMFYRVGENIPGNPWIITTLWFAQYHIAKARTIEDLTIAKGWLNWVVDHSSSSGVLSEQLNTFTGEQLSATPLTWSHAAFVVTVIQYLNKLEELDLCDNCNPLN